MCVPRVAQQEGYNNSCTVLKRVGFIGERKFWNVYLSTEHGIASRQGLETDKSLIFICQNCQLKIIYIGIACVMQSWKM